MTAIDSAPSKSRAICAENDHRARRSAAWTEPGQRAGGLLHSEICRTGHEMTKHQLAGVAAIILTSGVAAAQSYPPAPPVSYPPPPVPYSPPPVPVAPPSAVSGSGTSTTTVNPTPDGGYRASTTNKRVDPNGNEVTRKDVYREGIAGRSETHTKTETDSFGGTTTRSTTTTTPEANTASLP